MDTATALGNKILDHLRGGTAWTQPAGLYLSAHTADPLLTGANEVTVAGTNSYARQAITFGTAAASKSIANTVAATITMPSTLGANTEVTWLGIWDAATGGNFLYKCPIGGTNFEAVVTNASPGVFTAYAHGLAVGDRLVTTAGNLGGDTMASLGLTEGTVYFVGTVPTANTFTLSTTTANGAPVNTTGNGEMIIRKMTVQTFNAGNTLTAAIGAVVITL